ncbi:TIR domain-containing protein [Methylocella sp. CPCC 101449]|uniref:TIR domain-containing protein n=1 Tax=Methylocella sp. CPCC 101449 TaxID=2987531 RepID=UPI00288C74D0|nr:TIR domain-containing protein [Methylocella sp. CPCC 101449]MDT2021443.1 nucleotide-binding protein [Methylocella sp. CPCC 101449]
MPRAKTPVKKASKTPKPAIKRAYLKQSDVPMSSLADALRIPKAIDENFGGRATAPLQVALALKVDPGGSQLRVLSGASMAFGLIEGGAQAQAISLTPLAKSILRPTTEEQDAAARREAVLKPRVYREFLERYDKHSFPRHDIAANVLEELGVPREKCGEVLDRLQESAKSAGFLQESKGKTWVFLGVTAKPAPADGQDETPDDVITEAEQDAPERAKSEAQAAASAPAAPLAPLTPLAPSDAVQNTTMAAAKADDARRRKVFVTHGKDKTFVDPIKRMLEYGELEPVVSVERTSVSKPVPDKVMDDMRMSGAAIIHVDAERVLKDDDGNEIVIINPNVLIEIGAAMAFYGRRFVLLVRDGIKLPSNLQGLYEVRYKGDTLDADATMQLLEAMREMKTLPLPNEIGL